MVGQLVESNGDQFFFPAPKLHHPNCKRTVGYNFDHDFVPEEQRIKPLHATAILTSRCV